MGIDPGTAAAGVGILGTLAGGSGGGQAVIPPDLAGPRGESIALLRYLLGYGGSPSRGGSPDWNAPGGVRGALGAGQTRAGGLPQFGDPTQRLQSFFGQLGMPQSDLQRQSVSGIQQFLNGPAPEQTALDAINKILTQNPGQGMLDALQPRFQQNLSAANAQGPRFSSGNAILKSRALDDYNLLAQQSLQQGVQQQIQASDVARMLGESMFGRLTGAYGVGKDVAGQQDIETQRRLQILLNLLGVQQSATLGLPVQQGSNFFNQLGTAGNDFAAYWARTHPSGGRGSGNVPAGGNTGGGYYG